MNKKVFANFLLRLAIASVFAYAAIASFIAPLNWIGYFPVFLRDIVPQQILLNGFSLYELVLSLWLLSGKKTFYAAVIATITLVGIIIANIGLTDILFRDFAIILAAASLAVSEYKW